MKTYLVEVWGSFEVEAEDADEAEILAWEQIASGEDIDIRIEDEIGEVVD